MTNSDLSQLETIETFEGDDVEGTERPRLSGTWVELSAEFSLVQDR